MPQIYKVCVLNHLNDNSNEVFAIKPYLDSFDSFKDEIYIRLPELKNQQFRIYYEDEEGDKITIFNALDFGIFQEQKIKKVFIVKNSTTKSVQFQEKQNVAWSPAAAAPAPAPAPAASSATLSTSTSAPQLARVLHPNVICDGCDKSIFGYRYKCLECADFDLCAECEPKSHNHHLMIRIADPSDAEICYRSKLGKRFLRHRRSESLCMKSEEKEKEKDKRHHHGHHHKRHASTASGVRPPTVGDVLCSVLKSFAPVANGANANNKTSGGTEANKPSTNNAATAAAGNDSQKASSSSSSNTNATQTPTNPPAYGFNFQNPNGRPPCAVPLKHGIDMLQHVAQNFAAMMDPFATFMDQQNASGMAPTAPTATTTQSSTVNTAAAQAIKTATEAVKTAAEAAKLATAAAVNQTKNQNEETEPLIAVDSDDDELPEKVAGKPNQQAQDCLIVDCSDDDDEALRNLVTSMNVSRKSSGGGNSVDAATQAARKDERSGSIEGDKGSPSREWTFIDPNEIAESAGAVASNGGAIPKKATPPPSAQADESNGNNKVDYAELSRLLSTHIVAQNQATPSTSAQTDAKAQSDVVTDSAAKSAKTPPPTPMHPDARVNESLNAMMAMGFSNEGGWLTQLLETVDGSISNALDLLQPHK